MSDIVMKILIVVFALGVAGGAKYILKMKDDNHVEQFSEQMIKYHTGVEVDLSPEKDKEID